MLRCGKYRGQAFVKVAEDDRDYCGWILRESDDGIKKLPRDLNSFARYLREHHGGVLCVGRHKGKYFDEAIRDDPDYCFGWVASLADPGPALKAFAKYVAEQSATSRPSTTTPPKKRQRKESQGTCTICYSEPIDCVLVPCGHLCCCYDCALIVDDSDNRCPICRQDIAIIQKIYSA